MRKRKTGIVWLYVLASVFLVTLLPACGGSGSSAGTGGQADASVPSVPTGLTATAVSSTTINLAWHASTDDSGTVAGYKIYRNGTSIPLKSVAGSAASDTGLAASTSYCYAVTAYDGSGNESNMTAGVCATTQAGGGTTGGSDAGA